MFIGGNPHSFPAAGALAQGVFVVINSSGQVAAAGADADAVGVTLESAAAAGDVIAVNTIDGQSVVEVVASAAIAVGADVGTAADGEAVTAGTGVMALGIAVTATAASGEFVSVLLQKRAADSP